MKNLLLAIALMLGTISFSQIEVEQINFNGEKFFEYFEDAKCEVALSKRHIEIRSGTHNTRTYKIKERSEYSYYYYEELVPMIYLKIKPKYNICGIYIQKNYPYIVFEYTDGTLVINSGRGIHYTEL